MLECTILQNRGSIRFLLSKKTKNKDCLEDCRRMDADRPFQSDLFKISFQGLACLYTVFMLSLVTKPPLSVVTDESRLNSGCYYMGSI